MGNLIQSIAKHVEVLREEVVDSRTNYFRRECWFVRLGGRAEQIINMDNINSDMVSKMDFLVIMCGTRWQRS